MLLMAASGCWVANAHAQGASQQDLDRCADMLTAAEKLRCFEALANAGRAPEPTAAEPPLSPPPVGAPGAVEVPSDPADAVAVKPPVEPPPATQPLRRTPAKSAELGAEQLKTQEPQADDQPVTATVVKVSEGPLGNLYFHLDNGQVWRQIEARRFRYPKNLEFGILISQGMMGDYRLRTSPDSPATRIRRVE